MRRVFLIAIYLVMLISACSRASNDERAHFSKHGTGYVVEMRGRRRLMAHDPISLMRGETYEDTLTLQLPRIEGVIEGAEIPVSPDRLPYIGRVAITKGKMKVDLYYGENNTKHPLNWNGEYTLVQKHTTGTQ